MPTSLAHATCLRGCATRSCSVFGARVQHSERRARQHSELQLPAPLPLASEERQHQLLAHQPQQQLVSPRLASASPLQQHRQPASGLRHLNLASPLAPAPHQALAPNSHLSAPRQQQALAPQPVPLLSLAARHQRLRLARLGPPHQRLARRRRQRLPPASASPRRPRRLDLRSAHQQQEPRQRSARQQRRPPQALERPRLLLQPSAHKQRALRRSALPRVQAHPPSEVRVLEACSRRAT